MRSADGCELLVSTFCVITFCCVFLCVLSPLWVLMAMLNRSFPGVSVNIEKNGWRGGDNSGISIQAQICIYIYYIYIYLLPENQNHISTLKNHVWKSVFLLRPGP